MSSNVFDVISELEGRVQAEPQNGDLRRNLAQLYLVVANAVYDKHIGSPEVGEVVAAFPWYEKAFALRADGLDHAYVEAYYRAGTILLVIGKESDAVRYIEESLRLQEKITASHPLGQSRIRFLQTRSATITNIGHLMGEPDLLVKLFRLNWMPAFRPVLLADREKVCNPSGLTNDFVLFNVPHVPLPLRVEMIRPEGINAAIESVAKSSCGFTDVWAVPKSTPQLNVLLDQLNRMDECARTGQGRTPPM